jgi:protease IV
MHSSIIRACRFSPVAFCTAAMLMFSIALLAGCHHVPTINTNVNADGHLVSETSTPGNAGPVRQFTVPHTDEACGPAVAVIDVDGILLNMDMTGPGSAGENPVSLFRERLDAAAADPCTRAVVIRINSPGGGVTASDIMWHDLVQFKTRMHVPVVVCLLDTATGGAYYLATAGDQIIANPTTVTGGIGVILNLYNIHDFLQKNDVVAIPVKAGEHIDAGTSTREATAEERQQLEAIAGEFHERFKQVVLRARPAVQPMQAELFDGKPITGTYAAQVHLVDSLGYIDDAVEAARNIAGIGNARIVMYHRCNDRARTPYSITPNVPMQGEVAPLNFPGLSRARMPTFLYMWQPEPKMEMLGGR